MYVFIPTHPEALCLFKNSYILTAFDYNNSKHFLALMGDGWLDEEGCVKTYRLIN